MNKIEEIRDKKANSFNPYRREIETLSHIYNAGFDAAIGLDLPVLFADWMCESDCNPYPSTKDEKSTIEYGGNHYTPKELYNHWLTNIYNPEL